MADRLALFWAKVTKTPTCWVWTASVDRCGYGKFATGNRKWRRAHIWIWEQTQGPVPKGMRLLHDCDNPACVRIGEGHVKVGTQSQNMLDSYSRGRSTTRGVRGPDGKFTKAVPLLTTA